MNSQLTEKLLTLAVEQTGLSRENVLEAIHDPGWTEAEPMHDWRNHMTEALQQLWGDLPDKCKLVVYIVTAQHADREDWDSLLL